MAIVAASMSIPPSSISPGTVSCASCAVPFSQCQWCFGPEDYSDWPGAFGGPDDDELTSRFNRRLAFFAHIASKRKDGHHEHCCRDNHGSRKDLVSGGSSASGTVC